MAITPVSAGSADAPTTNDLVVDLSGAGLQQGDFVVVVCVERNTTDDTWSEGGGTWTLEADLFSTDNRVSNTGVFSKVMGATPDSSVTIHQAGAAAGMGAAWAAYRGVDATTPHDAATTTAAGANTGQADPPSITTVTNNALVIAVGAGSSGSGPTLGAPSGYNGDSLHGAANTNAWCGIASKEVASAGAENPGIFSVSPDSNFNSWEAATIALRPAAGAVARKHFLVLLGVGA